MAVNADDAVTDLPAFKHFLLLYKDLSDDGQPFPVIRCVSEWDTVLPMDSIPLYEEFFKKPDHTALEHPCPWNLPFSFLAVGQIRRFHIRIFVARTPYAKLPAMLTDMSVKPFNAFPKKFHVRRKTHMALIACGIAHAHVKVLKIRFPVWGQHFLEEFNVKTGCHLIADGTDYLVVGYGEGRVYHDSAEHLIVYVAVQMFHQLSVGESGVGFQDHEGNLCRRAENVPAPQTLFRQACGFCHAFKREHWVKPAKLTLIKTFAVFFQNIKFCKAQSWVNFGNILYLSHILV